MDLTITPERTGGDHTTFSLTPPTVCACGQPIHDGSTWIKTAPSR